MERGRGEGPAAGEGEEKNGIPEFLFSSSLPPPPALVSVYPSAMQEEAAAGAMEAERVIGGGGGGEVISGRSSVAEARRRKIKKDRKGRSETGRAIDSSSSWVCDFPALAARVQNGGRRKKIFIDQK